tara:strand:+ start:64 stop:555 length:492 start_codon:yes stop_codon:yes gene_type:complete
MAFRALLDYSNTRVVIGVDPAIGAEIAFPVLKSLLTFTNINGVIQYVDLEATNVFIDPDTKNLYFMGQYNSLNAESISFTEAIVSAVGLHKADDVALIEQLGIEFATSFADTASMSESFTKVVSFNKDFQGDSATIIESIGVVLILGKRSVLNTVPLNTSILN